MKSQQIVLCLIAVCVGIGYCCEYEEITDQIDKLNVKMYLLQDQLEIDQKYYNKVLTYKDLNMETKIQVRLANLQMKIDDIKEKVTSLISERLLCAKNAQNQAI